MAHLNKKASFIVELMVAITIAFTIIATAAPQVIGAIREHKNQQGCIFDYAQLIIYNEAPDFSGCPALNITYNSSTKIYTTNDIPNYNSCGLHPYSDSQAGDFRLSNEINDVIVTCQNNIKEYATLRCGSTECTPGKIGTINGTNICGGNQASQILLLIEGCGEEIDVFKFTF